MRARLAWALALAILPAYGRAAPPAMVVSPAPDRLALTVYRNPDRGRAAAIDLRYLGGLALITETRRIRLPAGQATVRFEGVAEGIVPVSAIVEGLPGGTVEKNRDARLLSPAALVDGTLGRGVTITRTDRATGQRRSMPATILSGPEGGILISSAAGIEAVRCSGLAEGLRFGTVPPGLSAKPVLSVVTRTPSAKTVTITLSYLATGFDWSASYVATIAKDGATLDLFAWLTLANANRQAFPDAEVLAVAGRLNRSRIETLDRQAGALRLACYPLGTTTSGLREQSFEQVDDIIVTASRVMAPMAVMAPPPPPPAPPPPPPPEDLGDLKLYRVPGRATVASNGQKQVALLSAGGIPFERRYRRAVYPGQNSAPLPTVIELVVENSKDAGLGIALPNGSTTLYADRAGDRLLLGTGALADRAAGETVRIGAGISRQVLVTQRMTAPDEGTVTAANANPFAVTVQVPIGAPGQQIAAEGLSRIDGIQTWTARIEPRGRATLVYRLADAR